MEHPSWYMGGRHIDGQVVVVKGYSGSNEPLRNHKQHSDTFEWGYTGSGPAQLALSLLADVAGLPYAERNYNLFELEVVAKLPRQSFAIFYDQIEAWIREHKEVDLHDGMILQVDKEFVTIKEEFVTEAGLVYRLSNNTVLVSEDTLLRLIHSGRYKIADGAERAKRG